MEMDNVSFASRADQDAMKNVYKDVADYIHALAGKPVMVAPFFITGEGMKPQAYADMWGYILASAPIDVVAVQDGIGKPRPLLIARVRGPMPRRSR
jgi:hypothetical protein